MHFNSENKLCRTKGRAGRILVFKEQAISKQNTDRGWYVYNFKLNEKQRKLILIQPVFWAKHWHKNVADVKESDTILDYINRSEWPE